MERKCFDCGLISGIFTHILTKKGEKWCCEGCFLTKYVKKSEKQSGARPLGDILD